MFLWQGGGIAYQFLLTYFFLFVPIRIDRPSKLVTLSIMDEAESTADKIWYDGNCHCGAVKYKVHHVPFERTTLSKCNCSICTRNGYLMSYPKRDEVVFLQGYETLKNYNFGSGTVDHKFCPLCGSSVMIDLNKAFMDSFGDALAMNVRRPCMRQD